MEKWKIFFFKMVEKLAHEVWKYKCMYKIKHTNSICFLFLEKCFSPKTKAKFLSYSFLSIFWVVLIIYKTDLFLIFSFSQPCFTIYKYHVYIVSLMHFFISATRVTPSRQNCWCFQVFQGSKWLNSCSLLWPHKQILTNFNN